MADEQVLYLHGDLELHIFEARHLPNMDIVSERLRRCFTGCDACRPTAHGDGDVSDGGGGSSSRHERKLHHHRKIITSDPYVTVSAPQEISGWFPVISSSGKPPKPGTALRLQMKFVPCDKNPLYKHGIAGDPLHRGVRHTYFPLRKGSSLTLYQDAHIRDDDKMPKIELDNGLIREHAKCWEDMCHAIAEAHHLIYIVGWSVFHKIKLIREPTRPLPRGGDLTLGELLKYKSQEGVRVLLLVWDDKTSHDKFYINTAGVMGTHDEETKKFFGIHLLYAFCHHVGTKAPREPWHDMHCRIDGPAAYDVLINFAQRWRKTTKWREFSLLKKTRSHWHDDAMIKIERISWILSPAFSVSKDGTYRPCPEDDPKLHVSREDHPENWHEQIFRSIDSGSVRGFPKFYDEAQTQNLVCSKNLVIDRSIQTAYIQAIRSAQHFIYIENQYFLGSSYAWPSYKDAGADHLIPMELAMKIASKIRANERFAVYVVVPMWPEGNPKDNVTQEILFWQGQTMQMMYQVIAKEIKSMQLLDSHPLDYLNFYCLGNREPITGTGAELSADADKISDSQKFQCFMIYVHAKGMVVDDEYVIIGSANINQRSMAGTKDTEIAMGAYQPHHTWARKQQHPHGQVYGYRMSLWAEHLGMVENCFSEPETLECVKRVNEVGEDNWKRYTSDNMMLLQGHLLKYPVAVDIDGNVSPLPGHENFPDVGGRVLGAHSPSIPDVLTT
ncbi:hypothetical protein DH2020_015204 [Rehmannia glutinosa]|uniref:Phospholipase D n=1 Tax=Rehmannia glutinosa TaxID=99300 RepID=A0ABR0WRY8_REHGL